MLSVTLDQHRLKIAGQPTIIQSGALYYFRLPHPALWRTALERLRMAGFNTVTLPVPWAYHSPAPGFYDFTGLRDLPRLLDEIARAGLWLIVHAGPWVGADLDAGGLPLWLLHIPEAWPGMSDDAPPVRFLHYVWEWWERLFALFKTCDNQILWCIDWGPCPAAAQPAYLQAFQAMTRRLGMRLPQVFARDITKAGWLTLAEQWREGTFPMDEIDRLAPDSFGALDLRTGPRIGWGRLSRERVELGLGAAHPGHAISSALGHGGTMYTLSPFHSGVSWGYWSASEVGQASGVGAPLGDGAALPDRYYETRKVALSTEILGRVLASAEPDEALYASTPEHLYAARGNAQTQVAFLRAGPKAGETHLSFPLGDSLVTSEPIQVPANQVRIVPVNWPLLGGFLHTTTLDIVLRAKVAQRHLLVLLNEDGGDIWLSDDFRVHHARGPVRAQRTREGLRVRFEKARLASLVLNTPVDEPLQLLALEPHLALRVWPLDDAWRTTPSYAAMWEPGLEDPARGVIIGPDLVRPRPDGSFNYLVAEKGSGYQWGPWRGSDPHTWLAPLIWRAPRTVSLPVLSKWDSVPAAPELLPDYDDSAWRRIPRGMPLAMEAFELYRGFVWYRGHFTGHATSVTLTFRHACDVFLNGDHIATLDKLPGAANLAPKTIRLPARSLNEGENVLAVLVECLGRAESSTAARSPHGLITCQLEDATVENAPPIVWRVRGGLSGERNVQGFPGYIDSTFDTQRAPALPAEAGHVAHHRATFSLALPKHTERPLFLTLAHVPARALIFLNKHLVGHYWETRGVQHRFWLPEGVLHRQGLNTLLIVQWTRGAKPGMGDAHLEGGTLYQWHHAPGARR